jgi:hypothetical protein
MARWSSRRDERATDHIRSKSSPSAEKLSPRFQMSMLHLCSRSAIGLSNVICRAWWARLYSAAASGAYSTGFGVLLPVGFVSRCCWRAKRIAKCWPMEWGLLAVGQSTSSTPWAVKDPHSVTKAPRRLVSELHAARIDAVVVLGCTDYQHA